MHFEWFNWFSSIFIFLILLFFRQFIYINFKTSIYSKLYSLLCYSKPRYSKNEELFCYKLSIKL